MKIRLLFGLAIALVSLSANSFGGGSIVINTSNKTSLDSSSLGPILIGKKNFWDGGKEVLIAVLKGDAEADATLKEVTGMDGNRFKSHWQRLAFSGRGRMPKLFSDAAELVAYVSSNDGAIGIVPSSADASSVKVAN
jgi:hypothetical protein